MFPIRNITYKITDGIYFIDRKRGLSHKYDINFEYKPKDEINYLPKGIFNIKKLNVFCIDKIILSKKREIELNSFLKRIEDLRIVNFCVDIKFTNENGLILFPILDYFSFLDSVISIEIRGKNRYNSGQYVYFNINNFWKLLSKKYFFEDFIFLYNPKVETCQSSRIIKLFEETINIPHLILDGIEFDTLSLKYFYKLTSLTNTFRISQLSLSNHKFLEGREYFLFLFGLFKNKSFIKTLEKFIVGASIYKWPNPCLKILCNIVNLASIKKNFMLEIDTNRKIEKSVLWMNNKRNWK
eukprot:snap_masked-scaffold_17-processed-gene-0.38-mRNA-1 protein AED:1.00 eAED:1.00 QI:0/-1/0/0/-1/1/1/0/296